MVQIAPLSSSLWACFFSDLIHLHRFKYDFNGHEFQNSKYESIQTSELQTWVSQLGYPRDISNLVCQKLNIFPFSENSTTICVLVLQAEYVGTIFKAVFSLPALTSAHFTSGINPSPSLHIHCGQFSSHDFCPRLVQKNSLLTGLPLSILVLFYFILPFSK